METKFFNMINDRGDRSMIVMRETTSGYCVIQYNQVLSNNKNDLEARNYIEQLMRENGWHLEEIITHSGENWWALTFELLNPETVINRVLYWRNGQYVQIGQDEQMSRKDAEIEYGYC